MTLHNIDNQIFQRILAVMSIQSKANLLDDTLSYDSQNQTELNIFILVNSRSGSRKGRQLIKKFNSKITVIQSDKKTHFYFYDLYSRHQKDMCFNQANQLCQKGNSVRIIISGGDGTVEWVISQAVKHKVNFERVVFGVLPIGTGNDFAKSVGWDSIKFTVSHKKLAELAFKIWKSDIGYYDIWSCKVECYKSGKITEIKNGEQRQLKDHMLQKIFSNYVGIGTDARISYLAQKLNAKSVFMKKVGYCVAWIQSVCKGSQKIAKTLKSFTHFGQSSASVSSKISHQLQLSHTMISQDNEQMIRDKEILIHEKDACLTFLNSTYSMELNHIWSTPYSVEERKIYKQQKIDDNTIEIVGYRNQLSLLLERKFHMAKKVAQGSGPFQMEFKEVERGKKQQTFIHINGQAYKIQNIQSLSIFRTKQIPSGKIKVLIYKQ